MESSGWLKTRQLPIGDGLKIEEAKKEDYNNSVRRKALNIASSIKS
jgi:hypothetical protein